MRRLFALTAAALLTLGIAGCGGDDGATGPQGPAGAPGAAGPPGPAGSPAVVLTPTTSPATFAALRLQANVTSVSIPTSGAAAGKPVVNFTLKTTEGTPVIGFGTTSKSSTATVAGYPNLGFALAKLVPASGGTPSKWVNYIVTSVPLQNQTGTINCPNNTVCTQRPGTDNTGTLVDNKDGSYTYTFYRDVTTMPAQVTAATNPANYTTPNKADLGDLSYSANATHRVVIQISGAAPGTGSNTPNGTTATAAVNLERPVDVIFDFVPATGAAPAASANRKMVDNANCESCHSTLGGLPGGDGGSLDFHGGARNNIEYCVICHTDQRAFGRAEAGYNATTRAFTSTTYKVNGRAVGNAPNFLHKIHVAGVMTKTNYDYGGVKFDLGGYSQDIRNCEKCHDPANTSTPQANLWNTSPNRLACGSCHDGINFDDGTGLTLGDKAQGLTQSTGFFGKAHPENATDATCQNAGCHGSGAGGDPKLQHFPVTPPSASSALHVRDGNSNTNAAWIASNSLRLPPGAIKIEYEIDQVGVSPTRNPWMKFRLKQNGVVTPLQDFATAALNPVTQQKEIWANFMGAPSVYFVFAMPQDNISAPSEFNATINLYLRCLWNGTAGTTGCGFSTTTGLPSTPTGTLTGPDPNGGWYIATVTSQALPAGATMLTGGLGYSYNNRSTMPLTQTNLPDYPATASTVPLGSTTVFPWPSSPNPGNADLFPGMPNAKGGLIVIAKNVQKVAAGFTGRRAIVDDTKCNACHQELGTFTEDAFHAGQRNDGSTCTWCHTPNRSSYGWPIITDNMTHAIHGAGVRTQKYTWHAVSATEGFWQIVYPGVLARCEQCHLPGTYDFTASGSAAAAGLSDGVDKRLFRTVASGTVAADASKSPYVSAGSFGSTFSFNATTQAITLPAGTNLVTSPTVNACVACHDSTIAISHFKVNGGTFYEARSTAVGATQKVEQCFVCHATGRTAGIKEMHAR